MSELRPCPFCGNEFPTITETQSKVVLIRCPQCNTTFSRDYYESGRGELGKQRTIEAWNRRTQPVQTVDTVEVVRCRDCVHFGECLVTENDYCSKGERKENL